VPHQLARIRLPQALLDLLNLPLLDIQVASHCLIQQKVSELAERTSNLSAERLRLLHKLAAFPESFVSDLSKYELQTVKRLQNKQPQSENLRISQDAIRVADALYGYEVDYGDQNAFEFELREHSECLAEAFRIQKRQNLRRKDVLSWRLPVTAAGCGKLLELLTGLQENLSKHNDKVTSEEELNELVFKLYGLSKDEQRVIDEFLTRYSSASKAMIAEEEEEHLEAPQKPDDINV